MKNCGLNGYEPRHTRLRDQQTQLQVHLIYKMTWTSWSGYWVDYCTAAVGGRSSWLSLLVLVTLTSFILPHQTRINLRWWWVDFHTVQRFLKTVGYYCKESFLLRVCPLSLQHWDRISRNQIHPSGSSVAPNAATGYVQVAGIPL